MTDADPPPGSPPGEPSRPKITDRTVSEVVERTRDVIRKTREMLESSRDLLDRVRSRDATPAAGEEGTEAEAGGDDARPADGRG